MVVRTIARQGEGVVMVPQYYRQSYVESVSLCAGFLTGYFNSWRNASRTGSVGIGLKAIPWTACRCSQASRWTCR